MEHIIKLVSERSNSVPSPVYGGSPEWVTRTSSTNTIVLQADFEGTLYAVNNNGSIAGRALALSGQYRLLPDGDWQSFFDDGLSITITNASTKPLRRTYTRNVEEGQYEVRFRKETPDIQGTQEVNVLSWVQLKSVQPDAGAYGGMGRVGVKIRASGQLNGALNEVSWLSTAKPMPYWNGSEWVTATVRANGLSNPGAQMLLYARGIYDDDGRLIAGMGLDDSQIDIESLQGFMVWCAANNFTFDHVFDSAISHADVLDSMAAVGFGAHTWAGGKLGVTWSANDQPIQGVVNMATMKAKTFAVNYQTVETADGIEYAYYDRDRSYTWKTLRVADPGVETILNPARITSVGVTSEAHAAILARFHLAQSIFQRKDIQYETDLEHLTYRRNSVMALSHDVTNWGYNGRLRGVVNNGGILTLKLDNPVPAGTARYIGLRVPGELGYRVFGVASFVGEASEITLTEVWPDGVAMPGDGADNPAHDTIWIYDFKSTPGQRVRVVSVTPQAWLKGATVNVVPDSDEFWNYVFNGAYEPPASASLLPFGVPEITNAKVTEELQRQGNTFYVELSLTFDVVGAFNRAEIWGATGAGVVQKIGETATRRFDWRGTINDVWQLGIRPYDSIGRPGSAVNLVYEVEGLSRPPSDITDLAVSGEGFTWTQATDADLKGSIFKFHYGHNLDSGTASPLHDGVIVSSPFEPKTRPNGLATVFAWNIDTSGNLSVKPGVVVLNLGDAPIANVVETLDFSGDGFDGTLTNCTVVDGELVADAVDSVYGTDSQSFYGQDTDPAYPQSTYAEMSYTTEPVLISSALAGSVVTAQIEYEGKDLILEYRRTGPGPVYGADTASFYPADGGSVYGAPDEWRRWPGQIAAENTAYQWRVTLGAGAVQGKIAGFQIVIDAPDIVETINDVALDISGTEIPYTESFTVIKGITLSLQAGASAAITVDIDKTNNLAPVATALDSSRTAVSGASADFTITGY